MSQNFTIDKKDTSLQLFKNEKKMFYLKVNWKKKAPSEMSSPIVKAFTGDLFTAAVLLLCLLTFPPESKAQQEQRLAKVEFKRAGLQILVSL